MSPITTHVLDTSKGCPAANIPVTLEILNDNSWQTIAKATTDSDGRIMDWMDSEMNDQAGNDMQTGQYRITFTTSNYHNNQGFFPSVTVNFIVEDTDQHYHVPLLLSPFSFSTYRGS